ncbi:MAG TPA: HEAT repeat domain-containing protein [Bacteroidota bacterium]|nr:HEAT repeat domain-containing protein [Bacteroidota bacterium]
MGIEFVIIASLALGAAIFVVIVAAALIGHKWFSGRKTRRLKRLYQVYSVIFSELLLEPLTPLPPGSKTSAIFKQYETLLIQIKAKLKRFSKRRRQLHLKALRNVLVDFAQDITGEPAERLLYFFYSFKFVDEEIAFLQSRHWWVRAQAARDLGLLKARRAIAPITAALEDPHPDVRAQAAQSLVAIVGVGALPTILRVSRNLSRWIALELSVIVKKFEHAAVPALLEALHHTDESVVLFCLEMLAEIGFVEAVDHVRVLAESSPHLKIQTKAVEVLGRLGDQRAEKLLLSLVAGPSKPLRMSALRALEKIGLPQATPLLLERVRNAELDEKLTAARALSATGALGVEHLRALIMDDKPLVRSVALQVLEEIETYHLVSAS